MAKFDWGSIKQKSEQSNAHKGNKNPAIFDWEPGSETHIRIAPWYHNGEKQPSPFHEYNVHYNAGGQGLTVLCNYEDHMFQTGDSPTFEQCPVCLARVRLYKQATDDDSRAMAKSLFSKHRVAFQGFVKGKENEGLRIFIVSKFTRDDLIGVFAEHDDATLFGDRGSYISVLVVDGDKQYHEKRVNLKTGKSSTGIHRVQLGVPDSMKPSLMEVKAALKTAGETVTFESVVDEWVRQNGHDLRNVLSADSAYVAPAEMTEKLLSSANGDLYAGLLSASKRRSLPPKGNKQLTVDDFEDDSKQPAKKGVVLDSPDDDLAVTSDDAGSDADEDFDLGEDDDLETPAGTADSDDILF